MVSEACDSERLSTLDGLPWLPSRPALYVLSLKALGTTSAPPDFSTPRIAYGRSAVMGNTYTSFSRTSRANGELAVTTAMNDGSLLRAAGFESTFLRRRLRVATPSGTLFSPNFTAMPAHRPSRSSRGRRSSASAQYARETSSERGASHPNTTVIGMRTDDEVYREAARRKRAHGL